MSEEKAKQNDGLFNIVKKICDVLHSARSGEMSFHSFRTAISTTDILFIEGLADSLLSAREEMEKAEPILKAANMLVKVWQDDGYTEYLEMVCASGDQEDYGKQELAELLLIEQVVKSQTPTKASK
jgi:hypothetical protein